MLFATTRSGMGLAITTLYDVAADALTVSCPKTKFMVAGVDVCDEDVAQSLWAPPPVLTCLTFAILAHS